MLFELGGPEIEVRPIHSEQFVIVVPASHALSKKSSVRLSETAHETYVLYERAHAPGFHDLVLGTLNRGGNTGSHPGCRRNADTDRIDSVRSRNFIIARLCRKDHESRGIPVQDSRQASDF